MELAHNAIRNPEDQATEGRRLIQFMEWEGMSTADLAQATGRGVSAVNKYQLGQLVIPRDVLHTLYFNFGLNVEWLMFGTGHHLNDRSDAKLAEGLKSMRSALQMVEEVLAKGSSKRKIKPAPTAEKVDQKL